MLRTKLHFCALAVLGSAAAVALAQNPPPPPPVGTQPPRTAPPAQQPADERTQPGQSYRVKQVLGTKVSIEGNVAIGTVDDIVFNDDGYVEYLIVQNEGKLVTVPWEAAKFDFKAQTATVNIAPERFRAIPTYTTTTYPNFHLPTYRTEIYRLYNLPPRVERRIERQDRRRP